MLRRIFLPLLTGEASISTHTQTTHTYTYTRDTHPGHELHEDGELPGVQVPQRAVVLDDALVMEVLQQLDLTLQGIHLLREKERDR